MFNLHIIPGWQQALRKCNLLLDNSYKGDFQDYNNHHKWARSNFRNPFFPQIETSPPLEVNDRDKKKQTFIIVPKY